MEGDTREREEDSAALRAQLVRGGLGSIMFKVAGAVLQFSLAVLLARALGPAGFGIYTFGYALVLLMAVPSAMGLPNLVVRETARAQAQGAWGLMRGMWTWAVLAAGILCIGAAVVSGLAAWQFRHVFSRVELVTFAWGLALLALLSWSNLTGGALRGLRKVLRGQLPEFIVRPALHLLLLTIVLLAADGALTADQAMALHAVAAALALAIGIVLVVRNLPPTLAAAPAAEYRTRQWARSALPLSLVVGMHLLHQYTDVVMLGALRESGEVGIYRVAAQGAFMVSFALNAINLAIAPQFACLHATGDRAGLEWVVTRGARLVMVLTAPMVLLLVLLGEPVLWIVFGTQYVAAYPALVILVAGQLCNAAFGSVAFLLNMTGHERDTARGMAISVAVNVLLNALLIPPYGIVGAAIASTVTLVMWNLLLWRAVRRRLGLDSTALGRH